MRYSLYMEGSNPFHDGHEWCVRQMLDEGKKVCIAIMDIHDEEPENNPFPTESVRKSIILRMFDEVNVGDVEVITIPAIESVNYGRDVGYAINELVPPEEIKEISATKIRNGQ